MHRWITLFFASFVVPAVCFAQVAAPPANLARALNDSFADVYEKISPSVVVIEVKVDPSKRGGPADAWEYFFRGPGFPGPGRPDAEPSPNQGSGVILRPDGYIVTNHHVIASATPGGISVVLKDGRTFPAKLVGTDERTDIAVLKVDASGLPAATLGDSDKVRVGEFAFALGAPYDLPNTFTFGLISATGRNHLLENTPNAFEDYLQTDAAINPGNSGGPLCNIDGRMVGMNTLINGLNRGLGFAIPVNQVKSVSDQLIAKGRVARPWLGIEIMGLGENDLLKQTFPDLTQGVVVDRIRRGTPAFSSSLRPGDVILRVDGREVAKAQDVQKAVLSRGIGEMVKLEIWRNGATLAVEIRTGEQPSQFLSAVYEPPPMAPPTNEPLPEPGNRELLGLKVEAVSPEMVQPLRLSEPKGVIVTEAARGSAAEVAGIQVGDVLTHVRGNPISTPDDLRKAIAGMDASRGLLVLIQREGLKTYAILKP